MTLYVHVVKNDCNKECSFCITKKQIKDTNTPQLLTIDSLEKFCSYYETFLIKNSIILDRIEITGGGEPTLNPDLYEIIYKLRKVFSDIPIHMYTNGIILFYIPSVDRITISTSLDELVDDCFSTTTLSAVEYYSKIAKDIRVRIYCNDDNIQTSNLDIGSFHLLSTNYPNLSFVFGKDFSDISLLGYKLNRYFTGNSNNIYLNMITKGIITVDENSKRCLEHPIIYTDGKIYKDWSKFIKQENEKETYGYHIDSIKKGIYGETSKIFEEVDEFKDAEKQNNKIMMLLELSDIIGAIKGYLDNYHKSISIMDLICMSETTERAFKNGERKN